MIFSFQKLSYTKWKSNFLDISSDQKFIKTFFINFISQKLLKTFKKSTTAHNYLHFLQSTAVEYCSQPTQKE